MTNKSEVSGDLNVLKSKRNATRYQILVEIAGRQPAVSQQEIADEIGVTAQAVSEYLQDLIKKGYVEKEKRRHYRVTKEGVNWLISRTEELRNFTDYVSEEVIGQVDIETALATASIDEGQPVTLSIQDGVLSATPGKTGSATAVAVTDAEKGEDVGVTDFEGLLDYELGDAIIISLPPVQEGGSKKADPEEIERYSEEVDLVGVAGVEAVAAVKKAQVDPDIHFGTPGAVREATAKGLDVLLVTVRKRLPEHTDELREQNIGYEVIDTDDS